MKRYITPMIALFVLFVPFFTDAATWQIDPDHSSFQFKVRHLTVSNVKGDFSKARGARHDGRQGYHQFEGGGNH